MPLLENLIAKMGGSRSEPAYGRGREQLRARLTGQLGAGEPQADSSLTGGGGEDSWVPSAAAGQSRQSLGALRGVERNSFTGAGRECGNPACRSAWTAFWKSHTVPIFEGRWVCGRACAQAMVRAALMRETGEWPEYEVPAPHQHRIPLGLVMLAHGWITHPNLQRALETQRANGFGRIGEWLVLECGLNPEQVTRGLSAQWNCPVLTLDGFAPQTMAAALPQVLIEQYGALPLRIAGGKVLYVGFKDHLDAAASFAIEQMSGLKTESGMMGEATFRKAQQRLLESSFPRQTISEESDRDSLVDAVASTIERTRPAASRLLKLHRYYWLRVWGETGDCRSGSTLPRNIDAVSDYLFTIEQHFRARQTSRVERSVDELLRADKATREQPDTTTEEPASDGYTPEMHEETLDGGTSDEAIVEPYEDAGIERSVVLRRPLAWSEPFTHACGQEIQTVSRAETVEPIDGEYLSDELSPREGTRPATDFLPLHRRSGWNHFQSWSRRGLTFLRREQDLSSGPGREG